MTFSNQVGRRKEYKFYKRGTVFPANQSTLWTESPIWNSSVSSFTKSSSNCLVLLLKHINKPEWFLQLFFIVCNFFLTKGGHSSIILLFLHLTLEVTQEAASKPAANPRHNATSSAWKQLWKTWLSFCHLITKPAD